MIISVLDGLPVARDKPSKSLATHHLKRRHSSTGTTASAPCLVTIGCIAETYAKKYAIYLASDLVSLIMQTLTASEARANLYRLIDQTNESHQPIVISGKRGNAVLLSSEDWDAIQETLYLLSVPGMRESIKQGMEEPIENCSKELDW